MYQDSFDELIDEGKHVFDASLVRKQFPSIILGQSSPVELYDGISDAPEKSNILTADIYSGSWDSIPNEFNQFSSYKIESISDQSTLDSTYSSKEENSSSSSSSSSSTLPSYAKSPNPVKSDLQCSISDPFELILDKSISCIPVLSKKQCTQLENCGLHTVGCVFFGISINTLVMFCSHKSSSFFFL